MKTPTKTPKKIHSQQTSSEKYNQKSVKVGKDADTNQTDEEILKKGTGSEIAKIIYRNSEVREEMMKWKKMDIIDFFIEKEDEHKKAIALTREAVVKEYEKYLEDYKKEAIILKESEIFEDGEEAERERILEFVKDVNVILDKKTLERLHKEDNHNISMKECGHDNCIFKRVQDFIKEELKKEVLKDSEGKMK